MPHLQPNVVWQDDGQETVQGDQHDQHVQQEEEQNDDDYCSDLENYFAEDKVFNCHFGWQRPSFTTSQSSAQSPLQEIWDEKVVVTQVTIYTVKQVQNIVTG